MSSSFSRGSWRPTKPAQLIPDKGWGDDTDETIANKLKFQFGQNPI